MKKNITLVLAVALALSAGCVCPTAPVGSEACSDETLVVAVHGVATADPAGADILKQEAVNQGDILECGVVLFDVLPSAIPGVSQVPVECCVDNIRTATDCTEIVAAVDACDALVR